MHQMVVSPQDAYTEILVHSVMVLGAFGSGFGHEDRALMNGISALIRGTPQSCLAPSTI